ncbi:MAG: DUF4340 domain-containing protein [Polyangiales bacterium]
MATGKEYVSYGLIAAAIGLGVLVFVDRDKPTTKEQGERAGMLLRVFRDEDVTRITLVRKGEKLELVKEGDLWNMTSPRTGRVDQLAVMGFMNTLRGARSQRSLGEVKGGERAQLGLDAPRSTAEIVMKGLTLKLSLGGPATGAQTDDAGVASAYVEIAPYGDQKGGVYVVEPDVVAVLDRPSDAFRETSLTGHLSSQYSKLDVSGIVHLDRGAHGTWRLPSGLRADPDVADGLFLAMYEMKAAPFVPDSTPVDTSKGATIEATLTDGGKVVIAFGGACPVDPTLVVAQARGTATETGCIHPTIADRLKWPAEKYVDPHAFGLIHGNMTVKTSEIESVVVESAGKKVLDAERRSDGLHVRVPSEAQVDKNPTDTYLARLASIAGTVVQSPDLAALGLASPAGKVTIRRLVEARAVGDAGQEVWEQVVEIGTPNLAEKVVHLRRVDDGAVLRVALELADPILAGAARSLRSEVLLPLNAESITRVNVHPDGDFPWELHKSGSVWDLKTPTGLGTDPSTANAIATDLATLACLRWIEKDDGTFGSVRSTVDVERVVPQADGGGPPSTFKLEIGVPAKDGVPARLAGTDAICVLPAAKLASVLKPPFDVHNLQFDPTFHGKRLVFTRDKTSRAIAFDEASKTWNDAGDAGTSVLAAKLGDAARGLRAASLVHLGPAKPEEGFSTPTLVIEGFDDQAKKKTLRIGAAGPSNTFYARVEGTDATYTINKADVDELLKNL